MQLKPIPGRYCNIYGWETALNHTSTCLNIIAQFGDVKFSNENEVGQKRYCGQPKEVRSTNIYRGKKNFECKNEDKYWTKKNKKYPKDRNKQRKYSTGEKREERGGFPKTPKLIAYFPKRTWFRLHFRKGLSIANSFHLVLSGNNRQPQVVFYPTFFNDQNAPLFIFLSLLFLVLSSKNQLAG